MRLGEENMRVGKLDSVLLSDAAGVARNLEAVGEARPPPQSFVCIPQAAACGGLLICCGICHGLAEPDLVRLRDMRWCSHALLDSAKVGILEVREVPRLSLKSSAEGCKFWYPLTLMGRNRPGLRGPLPDLQMTVG